ncbi:MAG: phenylalanine--tRNA ligase subunit beta [Nanoarchaeota archaeon]
MTILSLNRKEIENVIGKIKPDVEEKISMFGTPVENLSNEELSVEVFPNRPDLLSMQGFSRALLNFFEKKKIFEYTVNKPEKDYEVKVEKVVKSIRPFTVCAIIKGLKLDDQKIKNIIDIQEKLHLSIGRKRRKIAIGIYPLEKIKLPIRFTAKKPDDIKFIPLESEKELTGRQILRQHPTGKEYAHLLEDKEIFPIFIDAENKILSMPPIINSQETGKITENTKDVFIECSGHNLAYLKKSMNILVTAFADMGGVIYAMNIKDAKDFISPDLEPEKLKFSLDDINKTLGTKFNEKDIKRYLEKMGIKYEKINNENIAFIPAYRTDLLHWIDLAEEVAIAYGYEKFEPEIPSISTISEEDKQAIIKRTIEEILTGLQLLEASSFHLCKRQDIKKMHYDFKEFIELIESKTEYDTLRMDLITNLLKIISENSDSSYPQKIFEIGKVFKKNTQKETGIEENESLAIAITNENSNFTELKQILDYLFRMIDKEYSLEPVENSGYILGRCAKILVDKKEAGIIGEVSPRVLKNWKLKMPVCALEMKLDWIK